MIVLGTVDQSKEHIEIAYYVKAEDRGHEYLIVTTVALVAPYSLNSVILQWVLCPDTWEDGDDLMTGAVLKEVDCYLADLGGELSPWFHAIHRTLDDDVDRDCGVQWTWYPDDWWAWIDNSCWLPVSQLNDVVL